MAETPQPPDQRVEREPLPDQRAEREPLLARVIGAGARGGFRVAEATGIDRAIEELAEDAVLRALESPAAERAIARALESAAVERSLVRTLDSEMVDRIWRRLLASNEAQQLVERIAQAPEIRQAIAYQGVGLVDDIGAQIGRIARHVDDVLERVVRTVLLRRPRPRRAQQAGLFTRLLAFVIDGAIVNGLFFLAASLFTLSVDAIFNPASGADVAALVVGSLGWLTLTGSYLLGFWGLSGETPGMRFLDLRLYGPDGPRLGFRRSVRRLIGSVLGAIPLGLGFLLVLFGEQRKTFADRFAGTEMRYLPPRREAPWSQADYPERA
jgi:uncharacterized RDD family membrane protein YckC